MNLYDGYQKIANSIARKNGYGSATQIILGKRDSVIAHTPCGYRKYTTGEYVAKRYLQKFGWKNTYYQPAITVIEIAVYV